MNEGTDFEQYDVGLERMIEAMRRPGSGVPRTFHGTKQEEGIHRAKGERTYCSSR